MRLKDARSLAGEQAATGRPAEWGATSTAENQPTQPQSQLSALLSQNGKNNGSIGDAIVIHIHRIISISKAYFYVNLQSSTLSETTTVAAGPVVVDNTHDDSSSAGAKEDEEDDEDEEDKLEGGDPEKLKAFNVSHSGIYALL